MGQLSGFRYSDTIRKLRRAGFSFDRNAKGSHEIWINISTHKRKTVPNHPGTIPEGTLRAILSQAGLTPKEFLEL